MCRPSRRIWKRSLVELNKNIISLGQYLSAGCVSWFCKLSAPPDILVILQTWPLIIHPKLTRFLLVWVFSDCVYIWWQDNLRPVIGNALLLFLQRRDQSYEVASRFASSTTVRVWTQVNENILSLQSFQSLKAYIDVWRWRNSWYTSPIFLMTWELPISL